MNNMELNKGTINWVPKLYTCTIGLYGRANTKVNILLIYYKKYNIATQKRSNVGEPTQK